MSANVLHSKIRSEKGKGPMRRLRGNGLIPGIIYGKEEPLPVSINGKELEALLKKSRNKLITLNLEESDKKKKEKMVLIKEIQQHPFRDHLIHVDLFEISMDQKQRVRVSLSFTGTSKGVKLGGILNYVHRELDIECLPKDIPDDIEVDITDLDEGQSLHVKDLQLKDEIRVLNNPMDVLVAVVKPQAEEAPKEEEEAAEGEEKVAADKDAEGAKEKDKAKEGESA